MSALFTARLALDPLVRGDSAELFTVRGDPEVMKFWDWPHDSDPSMTAHLVEQMLREVASARACYWTMRLRSDRAFVGLCDLSELGANQSADIGIMIERKFWGLSLANEAIACILDEARSRGVIVVRARIHRENERSARLLVRAGFTEVPGVADVEVQPGLYRTCRRFEVALVEPAKS